MKILSAVILSLAVAGGAAYADCGKDHNAAGQKDAKAGHSCPMHGDKAAAKAKADEGTHACAHEAKGETAEKHACPMKDKTVAEKTDLEATGKVLCMKCNLQKEASCRKVFQPAGQEALYSVCPESDMAAIEKLSEHGEATLAVKGTMVKATDGTVAVKIEKVEKAKS